MKKIPKICIGVLSCTVVGIAAFGISRLVMDAPDASAQPYNLEAFGVQWEDFTETGVYLQELSSSYESIGFEHDVLNCQWRKFENAEGDMIVIDEQDRLRIFNRYGFNEHTAAEKISESELQAIAERAAMAVLSNATQFEVYDVSTHLYGSEGADVAMKRDVQREFDANDYAIFDLYEDGYIELFSVSYADVPEDFSPAELDARFEAYRTETIPTLYHNFLRCEEIYARYFAVNGVVYGEYSCTVVLGDPDDPETANTVVAVVFRAE